MTFTATGSPTLKISEMILTFSKVDFVRKIIDGEKIHTIREDKHNRWYAGRVIQFWFGNPRNVKKNPYQFKVGICMSTQKIEIKNKCVYIDNRELKLLSNKVELLSVQDGFDSAREYFEWFNKDFKGVIIHWTDYKY